MPEEEREEDEENSSLKEQEDAGSEEEQDGEAESAPDVGSCCGIEKKPQAETLKP